MCGYVRIPTMRRLGVHAARRPGAGVAGRQRRPVVLMGVAGRLGVCAHGRCMCEGHGRRGAPHGVSVPRAPPYRTPHHHHPAATPMSAQHASGCCHPPCTHVCVCASCAGVARMACAQVVGVAVAPRPSRPSLTRSPAHSMPHPPHPPPIACARALAPPGRRRGCTAQECRQYERGCQR